MQVLVFNKILIDVFIMKNILSLKMKNLSEYYCYNK